MFRNSCFLLVIIFVDITSLITEIEGASVGNDYLEVSLPVNNIQEIPEDVYNPDTYDIIYETVYEGTLSPEDPITDHPEITTEGCSDEGEIKYQYVVDILDGMVYIVQNTINSKPACNEATPAPTEQIIEDIHYLNSDYSDEEVNDIIEDSQYDYTGIRKRRSTDDITSSGSKSKSTIRDSQGPPGGGGALGSSGGPDFIIPMVNDTVEGNQENNNFTSSIDGNSMTTGINSTNVEPITQQYEEVSATESSDINDDDNTTIEYVVNIIEGIILFFANIVTTNPSFSDNVTLTTDEPPTTETTLVVDSENNYFDDLDWLRQVNLDSYDSNGDQNLKSAIVNNYTTTIIPPLEIGGDDSKRNIYTDEIFTRTQVLPVPPTSARSARSPELPGPTGIPGAPVYPTAPPAIQIKPPGKAKIIIEEKDHIFYNRRKKRTPTDVPPPDVITSPIVPTIIPTAIIPTTIIPGHVY